MSSTDVTELLDALQSGDDEAINQLFPVIYEELRKVARHQLHQERDDHTLNTTAPVHEVYLKLVERPPEVDWQDNSGSVRAALNVLCP